MEIDLDPDLAEELAREANERGFDGPDAYAQWVLAHRQSVIQPPDERLQARLDRVESELERLRRTITEGFETEITVESGPDVGDSPAAGAWFDEGGADAPDADGDDDVAESADTAGVSEFAYSGDLEPPAEDIDQETQPVEEAPEDAADDDEIAQALADVELEDDHPEQADDGDDTSE
ncbi:MAG: hypothetical protein ABEI98_01220 [Halorhabdus sp.]